MRHHRQWLRVAATAGIAVVMASPVAAQKKYDPGASDRDIKIGNTMPYSGPASAYGEIGKAYAAYFNKINAEGGINGRKINFISYDDGYSPPKTVEQSRKLVESDEVLLIFGALGTAHNTAIQRYMNAKKVPQLFVSSGGTKWNDPQHFPWTMGWVPNFQSEARIYAEYVVKNHPQGKVGVLYQNDDYGKDFLKGLKDGLNGKMRIVAEAPYETTDPTVDSQVINLKASGVGRRHRLQCCNAKIRRPGDQENRRARLETGPSPRLYLRLGGLGAQTCWVRQRQGRAEHGIPQRPDRSELEGRSGAQGVVGLHGQILSRWRQDVDQHGVWLFDCTDAGPGA